MNKAIDLEEQYCAHNYHPLPVVLTHGEGAFVAETQRTRASRLSSSARSPT